MFVEGVVEIDFLKIQEYFLCNKVHAVDCELTLHFPHFQVLHHQLAGVAHIEVFERFNVELAVFGLSSQQYIGLVLATLCFS